MNGSIPKPTGAGEPSREEMTTALFANLVIQNANMALMFLGRVPHPETGKAEVDLDAARLFIDQLEMLEVKTRGNLTSQEQHLLGQNLTALRLAFVEAAERPPAPAEPKAAPAPAAPAGPAAPAAEPAQPAEEAESRKKFTKKY